MLHVKTANTKSTLTSSSLENTAKNHQLGSPRTMPAATIGHCSSESSKASTHAPCVEILLKHSLDLSHTSGVELPRVNIRLKKSSKPPSFQPRLYTVLEKYKNQIDTIKNYRLWDFCKKLTNPFELIHSYDKFKNTNIGIAHYNPISRSYFKMWEMIRDFHLIDFSQPRLHFLGIAEGPGGFIDCIYSMRNKYSLEHHDTCTCMSLKSYKNNIPGWRNSKKLFRSNPSIQIYHGKDNTGDLYERCNIQGLYNLHLQRKAHLVTADGGFDFSIDYNQQEQQAHRLIMCEIIAALGCLHVNGHFVVKIFDIFSTLTGKILYFLTLFFEHVHIVKPFTSRPANSEKYVICKYFKGISSNYFQHLLDLVSNWHILADQDKQVEDIFTFQLPQDFSQSLQSYNLHIVARQIEMILKTLAYIRLHLKNKDIVDLRQKQALAACLWCQKYDMDINVKSHSLTSRSQNYTYIPNFI